MAKAPPKKPPPRKAPPRPAGKKPPVKPTTKPPVRPAGKPAAKPGATRPLSAAQEEGLYGPGGEQKWLKDWYAAQNKMGLNYSPQEWAKFTGYKPPDFVGQTKYSGLEGSMPWDNMPTTDAGKLLMINTATGGNYKDLASAQNALALPEVFAGRQQYVENLSGDAGRQHVASDPALQNVAMTDPRNDPNSMLRMMNEIMGAQARGEDYKGRLAERQGLVPTWAPGVDTSLQAAGIPFDTDLLGSPGINLNDPTKSLFALGQSPQSLGQLGVDQGGEAGVLATLSAEELMKNYWPIYYQYYHRPAGKEVPQGMEAGLTFGSPVYNADTGGYTFSPMRQTAEYNRALAYGFPGDPTQHGIVGDYPSGSWYNMLSGEGHAAPLPGVNPQGIAGDLAAGSLDPSWFYDPSVLNEMAGSMLGRIGAMAQGSYGGPDQWWWNIPQYAPYAPNLIGPEAISRMQDVANQLPAGQYNPLGG